MLGTARCQPRAAPVNSTAKVCSVNGTGVPGNGTWTRAESATKQVPASTNRTSRTQVPATRSASTSGPAGRAVGLTELT
jgi:hypothetical protein